ncbi:MAG: hypothetical protein QXS20_09915 [Candidatus Thorarchaeota archaeon]
MSVGWLFYCGVAGTAIYAVLSLGKVAETLKRKGASKFLLGTSFGAITTSILLRDGLPFNMPPEEMYVLFSIYIAVLSLLMIKRSLEILHTCESCRFEMHWSLCPGFAGILNDLLQKGFIYEKTGEEFQT